MGTQHERERDRRSFQDLARLAGPASSKSVSNSGVRSVGSSPGSSSDGAATKDDSGLIDLRALASEPSIDGIDGNVDRPSVTPLSSAPPGPALVSSTAVSQPSPSAPLADLARPVAPLSAQATLRSSVDAPGKRESRGGRVALVLGLAAIAAGAFVAVRVMNRPAPLAAAPAPVVTAPAAAAAVPASPATATANAVASSTPALEAKANGASTVDPSALPAAPVAAAPARHAAHGGKANAHASAEPDPKPSSEIPAGLQAAMAGASGSPPPPKVTAKDLPPSPQGNGGLGDAIKSSVGASGTPEAATTPAAALVAPAGSVPQRPSQGAVTGAIGAVIPEARGCLGPDDPVSRARVVFGSNGSVESITITGFAAGKPVEACIKAALGKAKVPPFAEASYGATVTVRP